MDKTREVYKEVADTMPTLNPFVDMPRMRVSAVNRINKLIDRDEPKLLKPLEHADGYECPNCGAGFGEFAPRVYKFCYECGQRFSATEIDF